MGEIGEYWRDVKEHRKRVKENREINPPRRRCFDWMVTSGVNYAKNRSSFKSYDHIRAVTLSSGVRVIGIGTVELQVPRTPNNPEVHTLVLNNVLHTPDSVCNGFNPRLLGGTTSFSEPLQSYEKDGRPSYYATIFCGLWRLVLDGEPEGESTLPELERNGALLSLSLFLTDEDEDRLFG
ncbi:hypothetical protein MferCBS31731_005244 [Microsporum ferrugineum]